MAVGGPEIAKITSPVKMIEEFVEITKKNILVLKEGELKRFFNETMKGIDKGETHDKFEPAGKGVTIFADCVKSLKDIPGEVNDQELEQFILAFEALDGDLTSDPGWDSLWKAAQAQAQEKGLPAADIEVVQKQLLSGYRFKILQFETLKFAAKEPEKFKKINLVLQNLNGAYLKAQLEREGNPIKSTIANYKEIIARKKALSGQEKLPASSQAEKENTISIQPVYMEGKPGVIDLKRTLGKIADALADPVPANKEKLIKFSPILQHKIIDLSEQAKQGKPLAQLYAPLAQLYAKEVIKRNKSLRDKQEHVISARSGRERSDAATTSAPLPPLSPPLPRAPSKEAAPSPQPVARSSSKRRFFPSLNIFKTKSKPAVVDALTEEAPLKIPLKIPPDIVMALSEPAIAEAFIAHAKKAFAMDSVSFLIDVGKFKELQTQLKSAQGIDKDKIQKEIKESILRIHEKYINQQSRTAINVGSSTINKMADVITRDSIEIKSEKAEKQRSNFLLESPEEDITKEVDISGLTIKDEDLPNAEQYIVDAEREIFGMLQHDVFGRFKSEAEKSQEKPQEKLAELSSLAKSLSSSAQLAQPLQVEPKKPKM